ncbi:unnamed protein product [Ixodes pacificus]
MVGGTPVCTLGHAHSPGRRPGSKRRMARPPDCSRMAGGPSGVPKPPRDCDLLCHGRRPRLPPGARRPHAQVRRAGGPEAAVGTGHRSSHPLGQSGSRSGAVVFSAGLDSARFCWEGRRLVDPARHSGRVSATGARRCPAAAGIGRQPPLVSGAPVVFGTGLGPCGTVQPAAVGAVGPRGSCLQGCP